MYFKGNFITAGIKRCMNIKAKFIILKYNAKIKFYSPSPIPAFKFVF